MGNCDALLCYLSRETEDTCITLLSLVKNAPKKGTNVRPDPSNKVQMDAWLTFNDSVLFQEGRGAGQGV